jgi:hypothetical protein
MYTYLGDKDGAVLSCPMVLVVVADIVGKLLIVC